MRNKKADLSLSTNAIVVLIIAITILGLALGFTRGIFNSLGKKIQDIGGQTIIENPPTLEKPMTLTNDRVEVRVGHSFDLGVGYFNNGATDIGEASVVLTSCTGEGGPADVEGSDDGFLLIAPGAKAVAINKIISFSTKIKVGINVPMGDYACSLAISDGTDNLEYKDLVITVN